MIVSRYPSARALVALCFVTLFTTFVHADGIHAWRVNASSIPVAAVKGLGVDGFGNSYVVGVVIGVAPFVVKLSPSGSIIWTRSIDGFEVTTLQTDSAGNCFLGGTDAARRVLIKLAPDGTELWRNNGASGHSGLAQVVALGPSGKCAVIDEEIVNGAGHFSRARINADGTSGSTEVLSSFRYVNAAAYGNSGMLYIAGDRNVGRFRSDDLDMDFTLNSPVYSIAPDNSGGCYAFTTGSPSNVSRFDAGTLLWTTSSQLDGGFDVTTMPNGESVSVGQENDHAGISRFQTDGSLELHRTFDGLLANVRVLPCDGGNDVYVASVTVATQATAFFVRRLSGTDFHPMWTAPGPGGSIALHYDGGTRRNYFMRNSQGEIFAAGTGAHGELFVDKIVERQFLSFIIQPPMIQASLIAKGTLTLSAPAEGTIVATLQSNSSHAIVPHTVTFAAGAVSTSFKILTTDPLGLPTTIHATITARALGVLKSADLSVEQANSAKFVSCNMPSTVIGGSSHTVEMIFRNTGSLSWSTGSLYQLRSEDPTDNLTWHLNRMQLINGPVPPLHNGKFLAVVTAPLVPGTYPFHWRPIAGAAHGPFAVAPQLQVKVLSPMAHSSSLVKGRHRKKHS